MTENVRITITLTPDRHLHHVFCSECATCEVVREEADGKFGVEFANPVPWWVLDESAIPASVAGMVAQAHREARRPSNA